MCSDDIFEVIVESARIDFDDVSPTTPGHFDGLPASGFHYLVENDAVQNDAHSGSLPSIAALDNFVTQYPMFLLFGWVIVNTSGEASVYITGLEFDGQESGRGVLDWDDIEEPAFLDLKESFYHQFKPAQRIEMKPEYFIADYCWTPGGDQ